MTYSGPVRHSRELERVLQLPRRRIDLAAAAQLAEQWSPQLLNERGKREWERIYSLPPDERELEIARFGKPKAVGGEGCPIRLKPEQAQALFEAYHCRGLFASMAVGAGKTLLSWLIALVLGAKRPVLLVPASAERSTHDKFADLARYWLSPRPAPQVLTYEKLGHPQRAFALCDCAACTNEDAEPAQPGGLRPDLVLLDESHRARNPMAAITRRLGRYMARHPSTTFCAMTGTAWRKSLKNAAPQLIWALKWGAPVPLTYQDLQEWCEALDLSSRGCRRDPGALLWLAGADPATVPTYEQRLAIAADAFRDRLLETPGFIQTDEQSCDQPLTIRFLKAPDDPVLDEAFQIFRETEATLDGWDLDDPLSYMRHATELGCGFYYYWDPRPPQAWLDARSAAAKRVREAIDASARSGKPLDTKAQVYRAFPEDPVLCHWKEIEPTFVPNTVARPITASVLGFAAAWIAQNGPALIWVQHDYVGQALSAMSGVPYFGAKGCDAQGRYIMKHSPNASAILSTASNMLERNLQAWSRNLVVGPAQAATAWEQGYLGRTHRQGQARPVHVDVLLSCAENLHAIQSAHSEARWVQSRGGQTPKLLIARYDWSHFPTAELEMLPIGHPSRARWNRPVKSNSVA